VTPSLFQVNTADRDYKFVPNTTINLKFGLDIGWQYKSNNTFDFTY